MYPPEVQCAVSSVLGDLFRMYGLLPPNGLTRTEVEQEVSLLAANVTRVLALGADGAELVQGSVMDELYGLGPLSPLLLVSEITEIEVENYRTVYCVWRGRRVRTNVDFLSEGHLLRIVNRACAPVSLDKASAMEFAFGGATFELCTQRRNSQLAVAIRRKYYVR